MGQRIVHGHVKWRRDGFGPITETVHFVQEELAVDVFRTVDDGKLILLELHFDIVNALKTIQALFDRQRSGHSHGATVALLEAVYVQPENLGVNLLGASSMRNR